MVTNRRVTEARARGYCPAMTYDLHIGERAYSSWSLRGWLMFDAFGLPVRTHDVPLYDGRKATALAALAPARTVPVLDLPDGTRIADTFAIAETLAERHPEVGSGPPTPPGAPPPAGSRPRCIRALRRCAAPAR